MCISIDWILLEKSFQTLCSVIPHNHISDIGISMPKLLKDGGEQLNKLISSSSPSDVRKINKKIIAYLIVKLCYSDSDTSEVRVCDVIDESIDSTDTPTGVQQIKHGTYVNAHIRMYVIAIYVIMLLPVNKQTSIIA